MKGSGNMKGLIVKDNEQISLADDLALPIAKEGEVFVKVLAASMNPYDLESAAGTYDAYFEEFGVDEAVKTGLEFSGVLTTDGMKFKKGDAVYGYVHLISGCKTHAEYIAIPEKYIALKPASISHEEASSLPIGILTSLEVYENLAKQTSSKSTLIIGAGGSVGTTAIQIAKLAGFNITTIGSPMQQSKLKELGADEVWDYSKVALPNITDKFDVILDLSTRYSLGDCLHMLTPNGIFVPALPDESKDPADLSKSEAYLLVMEGDGKLLDESKELVDAGKIVPIVDQIFQVDDYEKALQRLKEKGKIGKVILRWGKQA